MAKSPEEIRGQVIELLADLASREGVDENSELAELELDSMALSYIFAFMERTYGTVFDNDDLVVNNYTTAGDLCDKVQAKVLGTPS